ncbi:MAG: hypothetical protein ACI9ZQ_001864, partial [Porticoccaceae bacterium]
KFWWMQPQSPQKLDQAHKKARFGGLFYFY